jgi:hypothetical protein
VIRLHGQLSVMIPGQSKREKYEPRIRPWFIF